MRSSPLSTAMWAATVVGLLATSAPREAFAYVCTRVQDAAGNETGSSLSWFTRELTYAVDPDGAVNLPSTAVVDAIAWSFLIWQNLTDNGEGPSCSTWPDVIDVTFTETEKQTTRTVIGYDYLDPGANENLLIFYDTGWPHSDLGNGIIALTTTTFNASSGEILDADIEFNAEQFRFTVGNTRISTDLENTTVHEIGHFLGLGHTSDAEATMFAGAELGETKKRTLACDDRDGIVLKYPAGAPNGYCEPAVSSCGYCAPPGTPVADVSIAVESKDDGEDNGGCQGGSAPSLLGLALVLLLARLRRAPPLR